MFFTLLLSSVDNATKLTEYVVLSDVKLFNVFRVFWIKIPIIIKTTAYINNIIV